MTDKISGFSTAEPVAPVKGSNSSTAVSDKSSGEGSGSLPAAAQTGYGVKKHAPSTSTFNRGWNHANESKDRARAGASWVRSHHASPLGL